MPRDSAGKVKLGFDISEKRQITVETLEWRVGRVGVGLIIKERGHIQLLGQWESRSSYTDLSTWKAFLILL